MKKLFLLIGTLLFVSLLPAQNIFFVDFGYRFDDLKQEMETKGCAEILSEEGQERLVVAGLGAEITYHFQAGMLYRIDMVRHLQKRRQALKVFEQAQTYFAGIRAFVVGQPLEEKHHQHFRYHRTGRIFDLEYQTLPNQEIQLTLSSVSIHHLPLRKIEHHTPGTEVDMGMSLTLTR